MGGWTRIALECGRDGVHGLEEAMAAAGAVCVSFEDAGEQAGADPRFESWPPDRPLWGRVRVSGLFPAGADALGRIAPRLSPEVLREAQVSELPATDWVRAGRACIQPVRFGRRLWVSPTWGELPPEAAHGVVVRLDPGLAFGTGTHPSTRLCLQRLAGLDLAGRVVVDYGCGSGILGIAALRLGAKRCLAVDVDPRARDTARRNAARNAVAKGFETMPPEGVADRLGGGGSAGADVLVANLLAEDLASLASVFGALAAQDGELILSGILTGQEGALIEAHAPWFRLEASAGEEDWVLLAGPRVHAGGANGAGGAGGDRE